MVISVLRTLSTVSLCCWSSVEIDKYQKLGLQKVKIVKNADS